jgi:peptide/nickel transport system substrate-binding protein
LRAAGSYPTLAQVLAQVWPSAYYVTTNGVFVLNTSLLNAATEVSTSPQTVVYQINPRAAWSDGTPITYRDFAYNWQAQSGNSTFSDVGGQPYTPVDQTGYDEIASVKGNPVSPYTVTVTFSSPYPDWRSLFSYLVPAHIARRVGFDSGFTDPVADLVSGGPYSVSAVQPRYSLLLVRNPRYWGTPANLASVTYYFTTGTAETVDALVAGELDVALVPGQPATYQQLGTAGGLTVQAVASAAFEDLDFNEASGLLRSPLLREAVMMALDRPAMAAAVLGPYPLAANPVDNRLFIPGTAGYSNDGASYDQPAPAAGLQLLEANGYAQSGGLLRAAGGSPVSLSLAVDPDDLEAQQLAAQVVSDCAALGITVSLTNTGPNGKPPPGWQMAIEVRQVPVATSTVAARYAAGGADNADGYSSPAMSALLAEIPTVPAAQLPSLYGLVDSRAWADFVDIPLVWVPEMVVVKAGLLNVLPAGPYLGDLASGEANWGFALP